MSRRAASPARAYWPVILFEKFGAKFVGETAAKKGGDKLAPSRYVEAQGAFAERFAAAIRPRLELACGLELTAQTDFSEPLMRVNVDSAVRYLGGGMRPRPGTRRPRGIVAGALDHCVFRHVTS